MTAAPASRSSSLPVRGRLAPSPTGELHVGGAATFLVAWLEARASGGALVMRMEDLDGPRVRAGAAERISNDLRWLGLDWDEGPDAGGAVGPYAQSARRAWYDAALATLAAGGHTYLCDCSRAEIERLASAPHGPSDEGPRYPGTCRALGTEGRVFRRPPATRFRVPAGRVVEVRDELRGIVRQDVSAEVGDFVLRRGDGVVSYQLAVVVDDIAMGITQVVRGADLLGSTPRQVLLRDALGDRGTSTYLHTPLLLGPGGERLAKRSDGVPIADQRARHLAPADVLGALAWVLGIAPDEAPHDARSLLAIYDRSRLVREPVRAPHRLVAHPYSSHRLG